LRILSFQPFSKKQAPADGIVDVPVAKIGLLPVLMIGSNTQSQKRLF
jgi:hypothetical protein